MAWREVSVMDQRAEFARLARLEGANRRELCRRFGISAQTGYKWLERGVSGAYADRSRRPLSSPLRCPAPVEARVLGVRDAHPAWGARKIAAFLARRGLEVPAPSTVHAILVRHDRLRPRKGGAPAHLRFERAEPNELWQMDFKGSSTLGNGQKLFPLRVIDDHSRFVPTLAACANETGASVRPWLERSFRCYGLPQAFFVDRGNPWSDAQDTHWTRFEVWLLKLGIELIRARPYHPQSRGKNERFHRSLDEEVFAMRPPFASHDEAQRAFDRWRSLYNHERPHEGIGFQCPCDRYRSSPRSMPDILPQPEYHSSDIVRKVPAQNAVIGFKGKSWAVPKAFRGERLAIRPHDTDGTYGLYFGANLIKIIDIAA
jgi:transposase InsO family protein